MKRNLIKSGLLGAALAWVGIMSLFSPSEGRQTSEPAEDGSQAVIKFVDKSSFYNDDAGEITLRMDILDSAGKPILGITKDNLQVKEEGIPVTIKELHGPGTQPINVILVIDVSGSMRQRGKIAGAQNAARAAVEKLQVGRDRIGIIAFDSSATVVQRLADLTESVKSDCLTRISSLRPRGGTVIGKPSVEALQMFKDESPNGYKVVMVMTDGEDETLPESVEQIAQLSTDAGVPVYTIFFGSTTTEGIQAENVLRDLAKKCNAAFYNAPTGEELAKIYRAQVEELSKEFLVVFDSPYPQADGLPRTVVVTVKSPAGDLTSSNNYQIGPLIAGATRGAPKGIAAGQAGSGGSSTFLKLVLFLMLAALLIGGLFVPSRTDWLSRFAGTGSAGSTSSPSSNASSPVASSSSSAGGASQRPVRPVPATPVAPAQKGHVAPSRSGSASSKPAAKSSKPVAKQSPAQPGEVKSRLRKPPPPPKPGNR